ncbi:MAG: DUF192 domain-containing protein [Candidatus Aenigmarchaeota archaeon]|nr:DUF192 domain-containing protein [Candidatus Aenigmarchaeota archaeon]
MIKNKTKKSTIVKELEWADTVGKQTLGLMFRGKLESGAGFMMNFKFNRKHGIWMPFMRFLIDIIFIDKDKRIVDIKHSVLPIGVNPKTWKVYKPKEQCKYVLEVNAGLMKKTKSHVGDILEF